jgi:hypothetical protein
VRKPYHIVTRAARESAAVIEQFCRTNGQILLPILNLIENASQVVETVIHEIGHQTLEQILVLSAEQVAGPRTPGKASGEIRMSFLVHLDPGEACRLLEERARKLKAEIDAIAAGLADATARVARINLIESEYLVAMLRAERSWVRALERRIREGKLTWDLRAILREAAASRKTASQGRK